MTGRITVEHAPVKYRGIAVLAGTCALATVMLLVATALGQLLVESAVTALLPPVLLLTGIVAARRRGRPTAHPDRTVPVRRFQVQTGAGDSVPCVVYGDFAGAELRPGDLVRIRQHWPVRRNPRVVRRITLLYTLTGPELRRLKTRLPVRVSAERLASRLYVAVALFVVLWTGVFLARG